MALVAFAPYDAADPAEQFLAGLKPRSKFMQGSSFATRLVRRVAAIGLLLALPLAASAQTTQIQQLSAKVEALAAQVAKLQPRAAGVAAVPEDVVGTWTLTGFQSELHAGVGNWQVRSYVYNGSVVFTVDGKYKLSIVESGNELVNGGAVVNAFVKPEAVQRGKWRLKDNGVSLDGGAAIPLSADSMVMTRASANPADNTNVMLVLSKQP